MELNTNLIHYKQLSVNRHDKSKFVQFKEALEFVETGLLDVSKLITRRFKLEEIQEGLIMHVQQMV